MMMMIDDDDDDDDVWDPQSTSSVWCSEKCCSFFQPKLPICKHRKTFSFGKDFI